MANNGGPRGGPPPNYAPTPGPAGGIGYQPGANPCLPQGPNGYNYCNNGPAAHLPAGCFCDGPPPEPGEKTLTRDPAPFTPSQPAKKPVPPPPPPSPPPSKPQNIQLLQKTMNDRLRANLPYWVDRVLQPTSMFQARMAAPKSGSFRLDVSQLPPRTQIL